MMPLRSGMLQRYAEVSKNSHEKQQCGQKMLAFRGYGYIEGQQALTLKL